MIAFAHGVCLEVFRRITEKLSHNGDEKIKMQYEKQKGQLSLDEGLESLDSDRRLTANAEKMKKGEEYLDNKPAELSPNNK
jgi:hypothetical protein